MGPGELSALPRRHFASSAVVVRRGSRCVVGGEHERAVRDGSRAWRSGCGAEICPNIGVFDPVDDTVRTSDNWHLRAEVESEERARVHVTRRAALMPQKSWGILGIPCVKEV